MLDFKIVQTEVCKYFPFLYKYIIDICFGGSRIHSFVLNKKCFKQDSDLDIIVFIDEDIFKRFFYPHPSFYTLNLNEKRFLPVVPKFIYKDVRISIAIREGRPENHIYFERWKLPLYSLKYQKFYSYNYLHLLHYQQNIKSRITHMECWFCKSNKDLIFIRYSVFPKVKELEKHEILDNSAITICKSCMEKFFRLFSTPEYCIPKSDLEKHIF